jgi:DNA modification methylase
MDPVIAPAFSTPHVTLYVGDAFAVLRELPAGAVDCVVTSPPYWGLRDYDVVGQLGLEATPEAYVASLTAVFREVHRILRPHGTLWLNLGDSYSAAAKGNDKGWDKSGLSARRNGQRKIQDAQRAAIAPHRNFGGLKSKDMVGIPWRVAFALQADGWYLRSDIVWSKPNPMPESVTDRPTKSHEYVFLFAKSERYFFDQAAVREEASPASLARIAQPNFANQKGGPKDYATTGVNANRSMRKTIENFALNPGRNIRTVWEIATHPYAEAHFATFPEELPRRCILAGCPADGVVLDPFAGSGTTLAVARDLGRRAIGIELQPSYVPLIERRCAQLAMEMAL